MSEQIWGLLITTIIGPILAWYLKRSSKNLESIDEKLKEINEKIQKIANGTLMITRYRLLKDMTFFLEQGFIELKQLNELTLIYESYKDLGGNSVVTELFERCQNLPLRKDK